MSNLESAPGTGKSLLFEKVVDAAASAGESFGLRPMLVLPEGLTAEDISALSLVMLELARLRISQGFTVERDDSMHGELETAGGEYLTNAGYHSREEFPAGSASDSWPWPAEWWQPKTPISDAMCGCALGVLGIARRLRHGERTEG